MSNAPNTDKRKTPASKTAKAEAKRTTIDFVFRSAVYTLDPTRMTWTTLEADAAGNFLTVIRDLLGDEQYLEFMERNPSPIELDDDGELVNVSLEMRLALLEAMGNLAASSSS